MRSAARKYLNAAQLLDKSCTMIGTKCNILWNQFTAELTDSMTNNRVGYSDPGPVVLGTRGVNEYRRASLLCVQAGDRVLEIGCHCGKTTKLLGK